MCLLTSAADFYRLMTILSDYWYNVLVHAEALGLWWSSITFAQIMGHLSHLDVGRWGLRTYLGMLCVIYGTDKLDLVKVS